MIIDKEDEEDWEDLAMDFSVVNIQTRQPVNKGYYKWNEDTKVFSDCNVNHLIDFSKYEGVLIFVNSNCIVSTGSKCNIQTELNCVVSVKDNCQIIVRNNCDITANSFCDITAGDNCRIKTGDNCTIAVGKNCTVVHGKDCKIISREEKAFLDVSSAIREDDSKVNSKEEEKEEKKMTNKIVDNVKSDISKAGIRIIGRKVTDGVKTGIIAALKANGADDGILAMAAVFMESDTGKGILSFLLGIGLPHAPYLDKIPGLNKERIAMLTEELRIAGEAEVGTIIVNEVGKYIYPVLIESMKSIPAAFDSAPQLGEGLPDFLKVDAVKEVSVK